MRHLQVTDSDIIECIGYKPSAILKSGMVGTMEVVFKASPETVYRYENVHVQLFADLIGSESIGKSFHESFRKTKYPFEKSERDVKLANPMKSSAAVRDPDELCPNCGRGVDLRLETKRQQPHMGGEGPRHEPPTKQKRSKSR